MEINKEEANSPKGHPEKPQHSKFFIWIVLGLTQLIIIVAVFALGVSVGIHKARFTYSWASNYPSNFGQNGGAFIKTPPQAGQFFNDHGLDGIILTTSAGSVAIKDEDSNEKTILINQSTTIRQDSGNITAADLKTGEEIVVIGEANDQGQVQAKFIRVLN
jgi:hypothetical protein